MHIHTASEYELYFTMRGIYGPGSLVGEVKAFSGGTVACGLANSARNCYKTAK
jgi:hypothetical protein